MGILRKTGAILKFGAFFLPATVAVGGLATLLGLQISSYSKAKNSAEKFTETAQFQEIKEEQVAKIDEKKDLMTDEEYDELIKHVDSDGFLNEALASNFIEDDEIRNLYRQAKKEDSISIYFLIPFFTGSLASLAYATDTFREFWHIKDNMKDSPEDEEKKRRKKELRRREKEEKLYSEEVIER